MYDIHRINALPMEHLQFRDFLALALPLGRDHLSNLSTAVLHEQVGEDRAAAVAERIQDAACQDDAMRWMLRGLQTEKAIRKALTDAAVAMNAKHAEVGALQARRAPRRGSVITDPMQWMREPARAVERFVLKHGTMFEHRVLEACEHAIVDQAIMLARRRYGCFERDHCFSNSQRLVLSDPTMRLCYVEGYVVIDGSKLLPVPHAWATINGAVVDLTLPTPNGWLPGSSARCCEPGDQGTPPVPGEPRRARGAIFGRRYLGVTFLSEYVEARIWATNSMSALVVDHLEGRPVIARGGVGAIVSSVGRGWKPLRAST